MSKLLLVIDMQNDFIGGSLGTAEAKAIVNNVADKVEEYYKNGDRVIFTRDTHFENYLETQEGKFLPVPHCTKNTRGWDITAKLNVGSSYVQDKISFGSPELAQYIKGMGGIGEIELVGLCTDICVISNAIILKAFMPEVSITVDARCCAGVTKESHANALAAMKMCQINIINE